MQRLLFLLSISILLSSCKKEKTDGYFIQGSLDQAKNNSLVQLIRTEGRKTSVFDSTRITDKTFEFKGNIENPEMYFLTIEGIQGSLPVILENDKINLTIYTDSIFASSIKGGVENDYFNEYQKFITGIRHKNNKISEAFNTAREEQDTAKISSLREAYSNLIKENETYDIEFVTKNPKALLSALILERSILTKKIEIEKAKELFNNLDEKVKTSRAGKVISENILANENTAIGSVVPNFSAPNPDGKTIALNDIKGKITLIDFWAAWCGPCRKENPNVVKVYEKFHEKGLEIIGISLDGAPRQKEPKQAWLDAIKKDNLTWYQVSNLQYFNDPIAKQFNIKSIPATLLIDAEGKIIAKNLRGKALEDKIAALLN